MFREKLLEQFEKNISFYQVPEVGSVNCVDCSQRDFVLSHSQRSQPKS